MKTKHEDAVPKNLKSILEALTPNKRFECKDKTIYKILEHENKQVVFIQLDWSGDETGKKKIMQADT